MADINSTLIPLFEPIHGVLNTLKVMIGGVFGVYLLMLIFKVKEYFFLRKMMKNITIQINEIKTDLLELKKSNKTKIKSHIKKNKK